MAAAAVALAVAVAEGAQQGPWAAEGAEGEEEGVKRKGVMICKQAVHVPVGIA